MGKRIKQSFIEQLSSRVDIVEIINRRVPLKKVGGRNFQACCPFHSEKTPSFTVAADKGFYYCFGCGAKGSAIGFLMAYEHLSFVEAVEKLAEECHLHVEYEQYNEKKEKRQKNLYDLLDETATLYESQLLNQTGEASRHYLQSRQLDVETVRFFRLGYSLPGKHLQRHFSSTFDASDLEKAGLLVNGDNGAYDRFRERLMFPIRDPKGRVLGFGARALGEAQPKYLNSSETEVFSKRLVLYGLYEELQTNRHIEHLIVVEGYMDVIALHQMGVPGAVATLGTAFTPEHLHQVKRYTKKIFVCFDGDSAGKKAAQRAMDTLLPAMSLETEVRMVFLPDGEDPDTLVRQIGKDAFLEKIHNGKLLSEFVYETLVGDSDLSFVEGRGEVAARARACFDALPESDYKALLYQGLTARLGLDVYQLADNRPPSRTSRETWQPKSYGRYQAPSALALGGLESRLIRRLIEQPYLVHYVRHIHLLTHQKEADSGLLLRLILLLQTGEGTGSTSVDRVFRLLDKKDVVRLKQIIENEKLISETSSQESLETLNARYKEEFIAGYESLIYTIQRKNYFADLKFDAVVPINSSTIG